MTKRADLQYEDVMADIRDRIDDLDTKIVEMFVARQDLIREAAYRKIEHDVPSVLRDRIDFVRERAADKAEAQGLDADLVRRIYQMMIEYSCDLEDEIMALEAKKRKA